MILIADAGGSKTEWCQLSTSNQKHSLITTGFNPLIHPEQVLAANLTEKVLPWIKGSVREIFYYSAGLNTPAAQEKLTRLFKAHFPASTLHLHDDLLAAARGLLQRKPGIAGIIGTGANAGTYNGKVLMASPPSLGYMLGDEGGGAWLGKHLITDYFRAQMPEDLRQEFKAQFTPCFT